MALLTVGMLSKENISPIDQYVIDFVRKLRNDKELSQQKLGEIIGISREYVKDIENPKRTAKYNLKHINLLAEYFDISPKDFLPQNALDPNKKYKPSFNFKKK